MGQEIDMALVRSNKFGEDFCKALGLENVVSLNLRMAAGELVTVTAIFHATEDQVRGVKPDGLKQYALYERPIGNSWYSTWNNKVWKSQI